MPTLLLADGSTIIQRVVELTFSSEDIRVVTVTDGEDAIARIAAEPPDIVLAEVATPTRSGYEICAFVKERPEFAAIPVLLLAGAFEPVDDARAQQVGCNGIIVKPFEPQQVVARVKELLGGAPAQATYVSGVPRPLERLAPRAKPAHVPTDGFGPVQTDGGSDAGGGAVAASDGDGVEEYFERLDAAMSAKRDAEGMHEFAAESRLSADVIPTEDVPTLDRILGDAVTEVPPGTPVTTLPNPARMMSPPIEPPDASATLSAAAAIPGSTTETRSATGSSPIADAFTALLAVELGEPGARPVRLVTAAPELVVTEAMLDEVTRRVIQRLGPDAVTRVVADVVSEVAERLVREEIARIRQSTSLKSQVPHPESQ